MYNVVHEVYCDKLSTSLNRLIVIRIALPFIGRMLSLIASFWMVGAIYAALTAWIILGQ